MTMMYAGWIILLVINIFLVVAFNMPSIVKNQTQRTFVISLSYLFSTIEFVMAFEFMTIIEMPILMRVHSEVERLPNTEQKYSYSLSSN